MSSSNDSPDLEALFDSIAANLEQPAPVPVVKPSVQQSQSIKIDNLGDSDELQELFDTVSSSAASLPVTAERITSEGACGWSDQITVFNQIGQMARELHDSLSQLGYDKLIEKTVSAIPDAKDRLAYVANLTEQAACRVLNATDIAVPIVENIERDRASLASRWDKAFSNQLSVAEFRALALDTRGFFDSGLPNQGRILHSQLTEIMMAQDFQDLTGQVIKKIVGLAQELESGLMKVLLQIVPENKKTEELETLMNGPVINAEGRTDVVVNQEQVDDLLESLGF